MEEKVERVSEPERMEDSKGAKLSKSTWSTHTLTRSLQEHAPGPHGSTPDGILENREVDTAAKPHPEAISS